MVFWGAWVLRGRWLHITIVCFPDKNGPQVVLAEGRPQELASSCPELFQSLLFSPSGGRGRAGILPPRAVGLTKCNHAG